MNKIYTVSSIDEIFNTQAEAVAAWENAGRPQERGNSVWVTEMEYVDGCAETVRTITLQSA